MITRMRREIGDGQFKSEPCIDSMLLLDRTCDLLTPLPTQLTYEGLIDEFFELQNGKNLNVMVIGSKASVNKNN